MWKVDRVIQFHILVTLSLCMPLKSAPTECNFACTIGAYLSRRDAARVGQPAADAPEARIFTLIDFLGAPEDEDDHTFIQVEGRSGIRRKDNYTAC